MAVFWIAGMVAVFAWATAKEEILKELREECFKKWHKDERLHWIVRKLCYMPTCEYCTSFWYSLVTIFVFGQQVGYEGWRGYLLGHGATWALAVVYMSVYQLIRVDIRYEQMKADEKQRERDSLPATLPKGETA